MIIHEEDKILAEKRIYEIVFIIDTKTPEDEATRNAVPIPRRESVMQAVHRFEEIATKPESP